MTNLPKSVTVRANFLNVDGSELRSSLIPEDKSSRQAVIANDLDAILLQGRNTILFGIESFYKTMTERNPDQQIVRPSIYTTHLGLESQEGSVLNVEGSENGGVITRRSSLQDSTMGYWDAVRNVGFVPEIRKTSEKDDGGTWLLLKKPTLRQVQRNWFKDVSPSNAQFAEYEEQIRACRGESESKDALLTIRKIGELSVMHVEHDVPVAVNMQIANILTMAALKATAGDKIGSVEEVEDAISYGWSSPVTEDSAVLAMENSMYV